MSHHKHTPSVYMCVRICEIQLGMAHAGLNTEVGAPRDFPPPSCDPTHPLKYTQGKLLV